MKKRPPSITVLSWMFIAVGSIALFYHLTEINSQHPFDQGLVWACFVRCLAIVSGIFMLRGSNWARWLLAAWLAFHVGLSVLHSTFELVVHSLLFLVIVYFLFRPPASAYFRGKRPESSPNPKMDDTPTA